MTAVTRSAIVVPLYQYPLHSSTWQPLHDAILKYPSLDFVLIINPNSGPGVDPDGWYPDENYSREMPRLSFYQNVTIIGYVRLDYCHRPLEEVLLDIRKYASWSTHTPDHQDRDQIDTGSEVAIEGIFFDEIPNLYTDDATRYLDTVGQAVRGIKGINGKKLVVHNPGTVPDIEYAMHWMESSISSPRAPPRCDITACKITRFTPSSVRNSTTRPTISGAPDFTIVFEAPYHLWLQEPVQARLAKLLRYDRLKCGYMVHSVPQENVDDLVADLKVRGGYIFVTELKQKYYESFGNNWIHVIDSISVRGK